MTKEIIGKGFRVTLNTSEQILAALTSGLPLHPRGTDGLGRGITIWVPGIVTE